MKLERPIAVACLVALPAITYAEPEAAPKPKATTFLFAAPDVPPKLQARIQRRLGKALRLNPRLEVKDSDKLMAEFSGDIPVAEVQQVGADHDAALRLLTEGNASAALAKLEHVIQRYENLLPFIKKRRLANAHTALGVAQAALGKKKLAVRTFSRLFVWRPRASYPPLFDARYLPLFERAQRKAKKLKRGSIELNTDPPGARAYVDGRFVGATPTVAFGLSVGRHYATFKKAGYVKGGQLVEVDPSRQRSFSKALHQSQKYLILEEKLREARKALGQERANTAMTDLRVVLFVEQVIFAKIDQGPAGLQIQAYLYDLRSKLRLNQARTTCAPEKLACLDELARLVYVNVPYDGSVPTPPDPPPPPPVKRKRFYTRWWFWTAIAVGAAAIAIPIAVIPRSEECPGGTACVFVQN